MRCALIWDHANVFPVRRMCKVLEVHHSGYYAWLDWFDFLKTHKFKPSMSRHGNCYDKTVAIQFKESNCLLINYTAEKCKMVFEWK